MEYQNKIDKTKSKFRIKTSVEINDDAKINFIWL